MCSVIIYEGIRINLWRKIMDENTDWELILFYYFYKTYKVSVKL